MSEDLKRRILDYAKDDFVEIEKALKKNLGAHLEIVSDVAGHILFSGGKRLRPLLMIISARICGYSGKKAIYFSTLFEYLHSATLLHDDIIDDANLRRGKSAAHLLWGNPIVILVGDFLLARSLSISSETEIPRVIKIIADITENLSQGEIHQLTLKKNINLTQDEYMEIIRRKTAILIQGACLVGALIAGADEEKISALGDYGFNLGLVFQMADDLLDYTADTKALGKSTGADLREGKLTLPVIKALERAEPDDRALMEKIIMDDNFSRDDFKILLNMLDKYKGIEYTKNKAKLHVEIAKNSLSVFDDSLPKSILMDIADYALKRKY